MIKTYFFDYDYGMAKVTIAVDTDVLTKEPASAILDFYGWYCDSDTGAISEAVRMCAMDVIKAGVIFGNDLSKIKKFIKENNKLDLFGDKSGIKIIDFKPFQFDPDILELEDIEK
ncbi:hypothetical protein E4O05_01260 [Treponema sp. OMZ 787]|uniref:hypothetical protein n=1 Tax=Treponema sp. OMZ 787 TaxID=2563669 RepID=UPI0020A5D18D|nr:hypothetical protein [Treponema sp. OMZ 787]UTC62572.1 hypothetical protein E4O05_01260 [Treponema sp. OMZ 787]